MPMFYKRTEYNLSRIYVDVIISIVVSLNIFCDSAS